MLIGLHGRAYSGKDTAYRLLCEHPSTGLIIRKAFADPLKVSAARALGFDGNTEQCVEFCNRLKENGKWVMAGSGPATGSGNELTDPFVYDVCITGRQYLQNYGTEAHREVFGYDFWVDVALAKGTVIPNSTIVVFTDVRFVNEAVRIRDCGGEIWEIYRPSMASKDNHASEKRLPSALIDRVIRNDGTLDEFQDKLIEGIYERIGSI